MPAVHPLNSPRHRVYTGRHVTAAFVLDRKGIAEIAIGPELHGSCYNLIRNEALPYAKSISPKRSMGAGWGKEHYRDSFVIDTILTGLSPEAIGKPPMMRVGARLLNTARHAAALEWGSWKNNPLRILGKTLDHLETLGPKD